MSPSTNLTELSTDANASRYDRLFAAYEKGSLVASTNIERKQLLATYKLAWIICQKIG